MQETQSEKPELNLTDFANFNKDLVGRIDQYTIARNYLWKVLEDEKTEPLDLVIRNSKTMEEIAVFKLGRGQIFEYLLELLIDHSEQIVFDAWAALQANAVQACEMIGQIKKKREELIKNGG